MGIRSRHELIAITAARGGIPPDTGTTDIRSALPGQHPPVKLGDFPDASGRGTLPDCAQAPSDQRKPDNTTNSCSVANLVGPDAAGITATPAGGTGDLINLCWIHEFPRQMLPVP